ncbi:RlpA-like double-psi beta-barrel-protein domain-containing protein-containing protein [Globomyces pollinis-pini]|nr:RlpA-like double-psi beta-barrel-protein domain-containing protein-containing protein [Globomyces pollinis-pini]
MQLIISLMLLSLGMARPLQKRAIGGSASYYGPPTEAGPFGIGACGNDPINHDYYVAVGINAYDGSRCGQCIQVQFEGRTSIGPMADKCPGCGSGVDLSPRMMDELTGSAERTYQLGRIPVTWEYVPCPAGRGVVGGQSFYASSSSTVGSTPLNTGSGENKTLVGQCQSDTIQVCIGDYEWKDCQSQQELVCSSGTRCQQESKWIQCI